MCVHQFANLSWAVIERLRRIDYEKINGLDLCNSSVSNDDGGESMLIWHRRTDKHYGNRAYCDDRITKN